MDKDQQIAALTAERDALKPQVVQVAALTAERDTLKTQVTALTAERDTAQASLATLKADHEKAKHADVLAAALSSGHLPPSKKAWAEKQSLAALTDFLADAVPLLNQERQADGRNAGGYGLSEVELATCTRMGVTPEAYIATRDNKPLSKTA